MMRKHRIFWMLLAAVVAFRASVAPGATIIDTYPTSSGSVTRGSFATAQSFTAPSDGLLVSWQFTLAAGPGGGTVDFSVHNWDLAGPVGAALFSRSEAWPVAGGDVVVSGINLALVPGNLYGAQIDLLGYSGGSVHYSEQDEYFGGNGFWRDGGGVWSSHLGLDHAFRAEFGESRVPAPSTLVSLLSLGFVGLVGWWRKRWAS